MIKTLARTASHTARGIYAAILLNGGCACRKELLEAEYTSTVIHEAIVSLQAGGFVIKIGGSYKVSDFGMPVQFPESVNVVNSILTNKLTSRR